MDELDEKIISILKHGKKKQIEIVEMFESDYSGKTVRRHLEALEERYNKIEREGDSGRFYLPDRENKMVRPKPFADQEEVNKQLLEIKEGLSRIESIIPGMKDDELSNTQNALQNERLEDILIDITNSLSDFWHTTGNKHYILENQENIDAYFHIFDKILDFIEAVRDTVKLEVVPDELFEMFFMATSNIYDNWHDGKENIEFDDRIDKRIGRIISILEKSGNEAYPSLRTLLTSVSRETGQEMYKAILRSGNYDIDRLREDAFYIYDVHNEIHIFFSDLYDIESEVENQNIIRDIQDLREETKRLYTREAKADHE